MRRCAGTCGGFVTSCVLRVCIARGHFYKNVVSVCLCVFCVSFAKCSGGLPV